MTPEERNKLVGIRIKSKQGQGLTPDERKFMLEMFRKFPKEYPTEKEIFDIVKKFVNPFL